MQLSTIIVHHKNPELLKLCLRSLRDDIREDSRISGHEIIIVDSEAQKETGDWLTEDFPEVNYQPMAENCGYARGVNRGLDIAQGDYIFILNPDAMVTKGAVGDMIEYLKNNPGVGMVGPKLLSFNGRVQNSRFRFYRPFTIACRRTILGKTPWGKKYLSDFNLEDKGQGSIIFPDWMMGSALLTTRQAVQKVGLMDERFFLYFEDVDWAKRFWENGYKLAYLPQAVILHYHHRRSRAGLDMLDIFFRRETRWHLASALKYFLKHGWRYISGEDLLAKNSRNLQKTHAQQHI